MLNLTKQEQGVVLFLAFSLLVGGIVTLYNRYFGQVEIQQVNPNFVEKFKKSTEAINAQLDSSKQNLSIKHSFQTSRHDEIDKEKEQKFLININEAQKQELQNLPQVGPVLASRIIEYRKINGDYKSKEDLRNVKGIGSTTLKKISPYISLK
ncbi:MAG: ComEA family DNA-binding protein [bacterium]